MIVTVMCPSALVAAANQMAMTLGFGPAEAETYKEPAWVDGSGARYAVTSFQMELLTQSLSAPLRRPDWDQTGIIDMDQVHLAKAVLLIWRPAAGQTPADAPRPDPTRILVLCWEDPSEALQAAGLVPLPQAL